MSDPLACLVTGHGSAIFAGAAGCLTGQEPAGPDAAAALRTPHDDAGLTIISALSPQPHETRRPAHRNGGAGDPLTLVLLSCPSGVRVLRANEARGWAGLCLSWRLARPGGARVPGGRPA